MNKYQSYENWKAWREKDFGTCSLIQRRYFEKELYHSGVNIGSALNVLEIGFGNGSFAAYMNDIGCKYVGTELIPELVERGREKGFSVFQGTIGVNEEETFNSHFDLIVAFDVIEHMEIQDIIQFMGSAKAMLRPNGRLLARVPSGDSPFGRALFHGDLTHLTCLGSSAITQLAQMSEFKVLRIASPALPLRGVGAKRSLRRSFVISAQKLIGGLINLVYYGGVPKVINPNLVFVLENQDSNCLDGKNQ